MTIQRPGPSSLVTVVGLARSGEAAARYLLGLGCTVWVTEAAKSPALEAVAQELQGMGAVVELGGHSRPFVEEAHLVVTSPGVPLTAPPLRWARERGIPVVSELELGSWYALGRLAAVTGSNGKSTVATLLGKMLEAAGKEVVVCGNVGIPLCSVMDRIRPSTFVILEVSSFQLETSLSFHTEIACILNITDNHFDRHGSFAAYKGAKARILSHQGPQDWVLLNADDPGAKSLRSVARAQLLFFSRHKKVPGAYLEKGKLFLHLSPWERQEICSQKALARQGAHHEENALAASCMAGLLGVSPYAMAQTLLRFQGLTHRQEVIAVSQGITYVNDSKSTTVASGLRAIEVAPGQVVLIAGGRDKGSDFRKLLAFREKLKAAVVIGEDGPRIASALKGKVASYPAGSLEEAVEKASNLARPGEWVLLSPMCTSFDMFRDFEERGDRFAQAVRSITNGHA